MTVLAITIQAITIQAITVEAITIEAITIGRRFAAICTSAWDPVMDPCNFKLVVSDAAITNMP